MNIDTVGNRAETVTRETVNEPTNRERPAAKSQPAATPTPAPSSNDTTSQAVRELVRGDETESKSTKPEQEGQERAQEKEQNSELEQSFRNRKLKLNFSLDEDTQRVIVSVVDSETDEVVRQVPPEEMLRLAARLNEFRGTLFSSKV